MPTYIEVAVNVPQVSGAFHYHLPPELEGIVQPGHLVEVPFGHQRVQGVALRFVPQPEVPETRPVLSLVDQDTVLTSAQITLAEELSSSTLAPLAVCVSLMLPPGLGQQADTLYTPVPRQKPSSGRPLSSTQGRLLALLEQRGPLRGRQIDAALRHVDWRASAQGLVRLGLLATQPVLPAPSVQAKTARTARLAGSPEAAEAELPNLGKKGSQALERRQAILRHLLREPGPTDAAWLYAESGGSLADLRFLEERGLIILGEVEAWRDPLADLEFIPVEPPVLTPDQQFIWNELEKILQGLAAGEHSPPLLLHGVTGSGKTEIYLRAVAETMRQGKQAIVLVPEIALTPQTIRRFIARFAGQVGVMHSRLSPGERYDTWRRARHGQLNVMVGPRSALFAPFANLGLIVVDEFHDDTYYQADIQPHYHAREVAVMYARLTGAACLLGSATPDVVSRYRAEQGEWRYLSLPQRILAHRQTVQSQVERLGIASRYQPAGAQAETIELPPVQVVDMRKELQAGNRSIFSRSLQEALDQVLQHKLQAILFLNRRGTATYVFCRDCGYTLKCPRCDLPLTFHSPQAALTCHYCGYQRKLPQVCPNCKSTRIRQFGTGTERVEEEVRALYPQARTLRWDYETTRKKGAHDVILSHFVNHRADVLVGTQMIAKGLDLPLVTLVGVVLADVGLSLPDLRASERTFQVLTQVAGRAGRSPLGGQVILQSFQPDHYVIQAASRHDYQAFYQQELAYRRQLGYPPFARLVRLEYRNRDQAKAQQAAQRLALTIQEWLRTEGRRETEIIGPAPCFFARLGGLYRWQIVLRGPDPASFLRGRSLTADWRIEVDPPSLL
jgi:primosomal protein N' (replication factor Y)